MESFLPSEIARLVLGYLEEAKCPDAYETFLNSCPYLDECVKMKQDGRRFRTQVLGLTLLDILYEYSAIYSLVQERLKKLEPETAESLKSSGSLLDKITFLINATSSGQTMLFSITLPPGKSPQNSTVAHVRKRLKSTPGDRRKESKKVAHPQTSEVNTYPEIFDSRTGPAVIEATCLNSLPGNTSGTNEGVVDCYEHIEDITKTPKRKAQHIRKSRSNSANVEGNDENLDLTMVTKALLDPELHEKIAENINKVIYTPEINTVVGDPAGQELLLQQNPATTELNTNFCISNNFTMELDNAFKKIVEDTESDPVFEHLLEEVIGAVAEETSDDCDDRGISDTSTPYQSTPEINKKQLLKNRLRSSKLKRSESPLTSSSDLNTPNKIDYQNAAAIESIVLMNANAEHEKSTECNVTVIENTNKESETVPKEIQKELQVTVTSDTVVVSKPECNTVTVTASETKVTTVESVTQAMTVATTSAVVTSTTENVTSNVTVSKTILPTANSNLIMVSQHNSMPTQSAIVITETFCQQPLIQDNKIIFLSNQHGIGSQIVAVQPAQFQLSQSTVISDSDILSMPTVIMCGDDRQSAFVPTSVATKSIANNPTICPKGILNEPSTSSSVPAAAKEITKYKPKPKSKKKATVTTSTCETDSVKFFISVQAETKGTEVNLPTDTVQEASNSSASVPEVVAPSVPMISLESNKKEETDETEKSITPNKTSDSKVQVNLSTPRNGRSHVRALDFSTPANDNSSGRKSTSSPKHRGSQSKSPKSATKNVRENLFQSPIEIVNIPIATRSPMAKLAGDWDQVQGAGLIMGKEKSSHKTRNALSDSDIVVQSKTKNKIMETVPKIQRPRRAVTLKSKVKQTTDEVKPTTTTENVEETLNDSKEHVKTNPVVSMEKLPVDDESAAKLTRTKGKLDSWDKDLRALVKSVAVSKKKTAVTKKSPIVKKTPKRVVKIPRKRAKRKGANTSTEINKTDVDGLSIEKELEKMEAESQVKEKEETKKNDDNKTAVKVEIIVPKKRRQTKKTKAAGQKEKDTKELIVQPEVETEVTTQEVESKKEDSVVNENEGNGDNKEQGKEIIAENLRHMKPRYNKKCNVGSAIKKNIQECVQKYVENSEEIKCMTIMSPSKMNANKRTLVEHESNKEFVVQTKETLKVVEMANVIASAPSTSMASEVLDVSLCKITPNMCHSSTSNHITKKCNLTPVLETPMKCDSLLFPVTPKLFTPFSSTDSPFTKLFKDQPGSVDLSCIPTPNFPVTPKFIVTPNSQAGDSHGSYASRPTDYSNSSSYYQPSDSEQSQRLEQMLIQEAVKHDTNPHTVTSTPAKESSSIQKIQSDNKNINYILEETALPTCSTAEIVVAQTEVVDDNTETQREAVVQEPMKLLSIETQTYEQDCGNSIAPENTSPKRYSSDSSSSSSSSNSSSSDSDSSDEEEEKNCSANVTVIHTPENVEVKVDPVPERYALRSSTKSTPAQEKEKHEPDSSNDSIKLFLPKKRVSRRLTDTPPLKKTEEESSGQNKVLKSNVTRSHKMLLKELEVKRKRVQTGLKTDDDKPKKVNKKVVKSKKIIEENVPVTKPRKGRPRKNTAIKERISVIDIKPVKKKEKSNVTLKKLTSPRKSKTIEDVATRLKEQIPELNEPLNLKVVIPVASSSNTNTQMGTVLYGSNNTSLDSCESNSGEKERRHTYTSSVEDEEFPRLHISSDEDDPKSPDPSISEPPATRIKEDPQMLVRSLKERGIHLIPKKVIDEKDSTSEKEHLQESRGQECSVVSDKVKEINDVQTQLSENEYVTEKTNKAVSKGKKIKIRSDVILDEKIDLSTIELSQRVITDTIRGQSSKLNVNVHNNDEEKQTSDAPMPLVQESNKLGECINESVKREQNLSIYNSSASTTASEDSFTYEEFNVKIVTEDSPEYIKVVHDESIKCQKTISDYNLSDLLTKTIKAKVYIEELDIDQDRHLVITPFLDLLTIPPERKRRAANEASEVPTAASKTQKMRTKPLDNLFNELVDDSSGEDKLKRNIQTNTAKQDTPKIKVKEVQSKTKSKESVQKQVVETPKANEPQGGCSKDNQPATRATKRTITLEQYKNKNSKKKIEVAGGSGIDNVYRNSTEESDERVSEENEEDSLMTYAIVGKVETPAQDSNVKKRKATSSIDSSKQTNEKRIKSNDNQALLRVMADIDLDKFLTKVHGPSSQ